MRCGFKPYSPLQPERCLTIPAGNITTVERTQRLVAIKDLLEEGYSDADIGKELGMALPAVQRNKKYLEDLRVSDLSPEVIGEKRASLELELMTAAYDIYAQYKDFKTTKPSVANSYYRSFLSTIQLVMKLYGFDNVKQESYTQVNNQFNINEPDTLDSESKRRLVDSIKKSHDLRLRSKIDDS